MNNENTATAMVMSDPSALETRSLVRLEWSPESLALEVQNEKQMRVILKGYMKSAMIPEHHYYSFKDGDKPALTQEGAHSLCSLMKAIIGPPQLEKEYHGDHLTVTARVEIFNQNGERIATGDGICSTRESKYAYRWGKPEEIPPGVDKSTLKTRGGTNNNGSKWQQFQLPNQDLPDLYNTVLKMAVKRAKVAGVRQLPLVSELFTTDDPDDTDHELTKQPAARGNGPSSTKTPPVPQKDKETAVETVVLLTGKLIDRGLELEDLAVQFLPEGVAEFKDLTTEQAEAIKPAIVELLNAELKKK